MLKAIVTSQLDACILTPTTHTHTHTHTLAAYYKGLPYKDIQGSTTTTKAILHDVIVVQVVQVVQVVSWRGPGQLK